jgi:DNA-binding response OmpR family regulator
MGEPIPVMILGENQAICRSLRSDLEKLGFRTIPGRYPDIDKEDIIRKPPRIIVLELSAFDYKAKSVCDLLLHENVLPPETALVALVSEKILGQVPLDYTFADVIRFPYDTAELGFRLRRAMYLHYPEAGKDVIRIGNLSISLSRYEVKVDGQPVVLSHKEYELFKYLITHPDRVFTRRMLLTTIWGYKLTSVSRTVDVHIRRVRAKIGDSDHTYIKTVRGVGYAFRFEGK